MIFSTRKKSGYSGYKVTFRARDTHPVLNAVAKCLFDDLPLDIAKNICFSMINDKPQLVVKVDTLIP